MTEQGYLKRDFQGCWTLNGVILHGNSNIDIRIDGNWVSGTIEKWNDDYHWFSKLDGVPVILHTGVVARRAMNNKGGIT